MDISEDDWLRREDRVEIAQGAVESLTADEPDRVIWLHELGNALRARSQKTGALEDLDNAIQFGREAINTAPHDFPHLAVLLDGLACHLGYRFEVAGSVADIEEAIEKTRNAIRVTPSDASSRPRFLNTLATGLHLRYKATGSTIDLQEAFQMAQESVDATPQLGRQKAHYSDVLAVIEHSRYDRSGRLCELENALALWRQAINMTAQESDIRARLMINLGFGLEGLYPRTRKIAHLDEAIEVTRNGLDIASSIGVVKPSSLNTLACLFKARFHQTRNMDDIMEAIQLGNKAIGSTPHSHHNRAIYLNTLAECHISRFVVRRCPDDVEIAASYFELSFHHNSSDVVSRISAGKDLFSSFVALCKWDKALQTSDRTFALLPKLALRSLGVSDRQYLLGRVIGLACDAAAVAMKVGRSPITALKTLERGRAILASSIEETRVDLSDLQTGHPELADQFMRVRNELDTPLHYSNALVSQSMAVRRGKASQEFDVLLHEIRQKHGFSDFLEPASESKMRAAAGPGPIIIINLSQVRCDAIIIEEHQIRSLALHGLTSEELETKDTQGYLKNRKALEWLWDVAASPILHALKLTQPATADNWPHVWWVLTGRLSKLPMHAAGYHHRGSTETVLDRVMSSYSPSVQAIIDGRRRQCPSWSQTFPRRVTLVAMSDTIGHTGLPFAASEVSMLREICRSLSLTTSEPRRWREDVLEDLQGCSIFHFAGHGTTNKDPAYSGLVLEDGTLTVASLMEKNLRECSPFLAYLSACGTGQTGGGSFFDENIHLISACQLAGFRHAIGTMQEVDDGTCMEVTRLAYESMGREGFTDEAVCRALHKAIRELRDHCIEASEQGVQESMRSQEIFQQHPRKEPGRDIILCKEMETCNDWQSWVPFVHFGV